MSKVEEMDGFGQLSEHDKDQLRKFEVWMRRRIEKPDEPSFHAYGEVFSEVVFEDKS